MDFALAAPTDAAICAEKDSNADGGLSQDEFFAAYPDASADVRTAAEANATVLVSDTERQAAVYGGALPVK